MMERNRKEHISKELVPYLILDELADVESFKVMMEAEGIEIALQWRYYYGYNDAIRIIDFVETKGIYDAWAVLLPKDCQEKADEIRLKHRSILDYFEPAEERFFRGLKTADLEKALASQQMNGRSLELALKILQEKNITYKAPEIQALKEALVQKNAQKVAKIGRTKIFIWAILVVIITGYLYLIGLFS
ncbi:MAG: Unknown protein [uncultured Aureispira sp.]|uniref:Uncharacterized protein n=1 Tax=uncultured Aureispira sp. TaxID=1331704 RepID=A0A6S6RWA7_9BACT|nr:MAG: Unknown protein [uncultured Aureispira sp.]